MDLINSKQLMGIALAALGLFLLSRLDRKFNKYSLLLGLVSSFLIVFFIINFLIHLISYTLAKSLDWLKLEDF